MVFSVVCALSEQVCVVGTIPVVSDELQAWTRGGRKVCSRHGDETLKTLKTLGSEYSAGSSQSVSVHQTLSVL